MFYSSAGTLSIIILLIINKDVLGKSSMKEVDPAIRHYRSFLAAVLIYDLTDVLWGILYEHGMITLTYIDTMIYFIALAACILTWTRYVLAYLREEKNAFSKVLTAAGYIIFFFQIGMVVLNKFAPWMFWFDEKGVYHAGSARYFAMGIQMLMFMMSAIYALNVSLKSEGATRARYRTIGFVSLTMAVFVTLQVLFPLLPFSAVGYLLAACMLHIFVLENEKEEYRDELEKQLKENVLKGNYYDLLTGLPGMTYFFDLAAKKRSELVVSGGSPAFLFMNMNGMKFYNQKYGFNAGNDVLWSFAQMLKTRFGEENCSRFGEDHFVVFTEEKGLKEAMEKLLTDWEEQQGNEAPTIHAGVYLDHQLTEDISVACDRAKAACDDIGKTYFSSVRYYDTVMLERAEKQQYIVSHIDQAVEEGWINVYYQPIVRSSNGWVCDEEALARWIDPVRGILSPADFIPYLEEAGQLYKLDLYVVEQVLYKLKRIQAAGLDQVPQSVNLSRADFDSCDIVEEIRKRVDAADIPRSLLTIEITESIIGSDFDFMKEQIDRFRELGFCVWMDDFGSGYSSLDLLQSIHVDLIKFDMHFMRQFDQSEKSRVILTELMKLTIGLGIDTLCEGVENEEQLEFLREIGCNKLQGFYYTKPICEEEILERYRKGRQIGFENPSEAGYYDAIGRVNLYDLASISDEDADDMNYYFNTIPMAVIEVRGEKARFTRSNQSYRDFMQQVFGFSLKGLPPTFEETPEGPGKPFVIKLRQCCAEGGRKAFDEMMPDGTRIHSFMRKIAENPKTGTTAAVVAVLSINRPLRSDDEETEADADAEIE